MPVTTDYLATLKLQLEAAATNKKAALDAAYERATNKVFDSSGNISTRKTPAGNETGPGTLDVQYAEQQRNIGTSNEASGTLKSGQYGRELATSQAGYRSTIAGLAADTAAGKTAADTDAASELAKYQAMYGGSNQPTTGGSTTPAATGGSGGGSTGGNGGGTQKPTDPTGDAPTVDPAPIFANPDYNKPTSNIPSTVFKVTPGMEASAAASKGTYYGSDQAAADVNQIKKIISNKVIPPAKKLVPVPNKVKTISSTRM